MTYKTPPTSEWVERTVPTCPGCRWHVNVRVHLPTYVMLGPVNDDGSVVVLCPMDHHLKDGTPNPQLRVWYDHDAARDLEYEFAPCLG